VVGFTEQVTENSHRLRGLLGTAVGLQGGVQGIGGGGCGESRNGNLIQQFGPAHKRVAGAFGCLISHLLHHQIGRTIRTGHFDGIPF